MLIRLRHPIRYRIGGVAIALVLAGAAPASALGPGAVRLDDFFPWLQNAPGAPTIEASQASRLFSIDLPSARQASFWTVPTTDGRVCVATRIVDEATGSAPAGSPPAFANGGLNCSIGGATQPAGQIQTFLDWTPASGPFARPTSSEWTVTLLGHLPAGNTATTVALRSSNGATTALPLRDGFFAAVLPGTTSNLSTLPGTFTVVARDQTGSQVGSVDLNTFLKNASP